MALKKHIAFLLPNFNGGGAEKVIITYCNALAERGYQVSLLAGVANGPATDLISSLVRIVNLECPRIVLAVFKIRRWLKANRASVLIATLTNANVAAVLAGKFLSTGTRVIIREASTPSMAVKYHSGSSVYKLAKMVFRYADVFIAVSKAIKDDAITFYGLEKGKVVVVYNPNTVGCSSVLPNHPFYKKDQSTPIVLGIGRFTKVKNFSLLVAGFKKVLIQKPSAKLIIIGQQDLDQTEFRHVENQIKNHNLEANVSLPGYKSDPENYLSHSSVFVLSSLYEGLPNVLIQALACGTPVVSTDCCGGVKEILVDGKMGYIAKNENEDDLAEGILQQLTNPFPSVEERIERAAFFSLENAVKKLEELI